MGTLVESREAITLRPSQLDPDVPVAVHPAPDNLGSVTLAHVDVIVTRFVYRHQILGFPIGVVAVDVMEVNPFFPHEALYPKPRYATARAWFGSCFSTETALDRTASPLTPTES